MLFECVINLPNFRHIQNDWWSYREHAAMLSFQNHACSGVVSVWSAKMRSFRTVIFCSNIAWPWNILRQTKSISIFKVLTAFKIVEYRKGVRSKYIHCVFILQRTPCGIGLRQNLVLGLSFSRKLIQSNS